LNADLISLPESPEVYSLGYLKATSEKSNRHLIMEARVCPMCKSTDIASIYGRTFGDQYKCNACDWQGFTVVMDLEKKG
jgi:predicted RNA-binding Zn-ribbon protein involved in translation (DUF1610 family)